MEKSSGLFGLFFISLAVSGYIFSTYCHYLKYKTAREAGHRLYLTSITIGLMFAFLGEFLIELVRLIVLLIFSIFDDSFYLLSLLPNQRVLALTILLPTLAVAFTFYFNSRPQSKSKNLKRVWEKDDFSSLVSFAADNNKPLTITLDNRKSYIGLVARTNEPQHDCSYLTLLPLYSGYREESDLKLHITNEYDEVFDFFEGESDFSIEDFYIVIPLNRIISTHVFNYDIYERINSD